MSLFAKCFDINVVHVGRIFQFNTDKMTRSSINFQSQEVQDLETKLEAGK